MPQSNQDLLARIDSALKALTVGDLGAGVLQPEKAERFIRTVSHATPILDSARLIRMNSTQRDIDRVGFNTRVLQAPATAEASPGTQKPAFATNVLNAVKVKGAPAINDDTLEENIETEGFENTLLDLIADQAGRDLEELYLNGDTTSGDTYLALIDGWMVLSANVVSGAGTAPDFTNTDPEAALEAALVAVPKNFLRDRSQWTYWVDWDLENDYRDVLRQRGTGLGDQAQVGHSPVAYKGISLRESFTMAAGSGILVPNGNLVYGVFRDIRIERDRDALAEETMFVITMRTDAHFEDENASVVISGYVGP